MLKDLIEQLAGVQNAVQRVVSYLEGGNCATSVNNEDVLRQVLPLIAARTGHRGDRWKWSHVQKVLVDDGYIPADMKVRAMARYLHELCPEVSEHHVRNSVVNNPLCLSSELAHVHYRSLPVGRTQLRAICIEIGELLVSTD